MSWTPAIDPECEEREPSSGIELTIEARPRSKLELPDDYEQRAAYIVEGAVSSNGERGDAGRMLVFSPGTPIVLRALSPTRLMLLGGSSLDGERHIWWNFVSSSQERIERAKQDWKAGRFAKVPGDDVEFIPLPE